MTAVKPGLLRTLELLDKEARQYPNLWCERSLTRGLSLARRHLTNGPDRGDTLALHREGAMPSDIEVQIITGKLVELGWGVVDRADRPDRGTILLTLAAQSSTSGNLDLFA